MMINIFVWSTISHLSFLISYRSSLGRYDGDVYSSILQSTTSSNQPPSHNLSHNQPSSSHDQPSHNQPSSSCDYIELIKQRSDLSNSEISFW